MHLQSIRLRNYKCFQDFEMALNQDYNLHVILAPNMVGKSALMRGLRVASSTFLSKISRPNSKGIEKKEHRVLGTNPLSDVARECSVEVKAMMASWNSRSNSWENKEYHWKRYRNNLSENTKVKNITHDLPKDAQKRYDRVLEHKEYHVPLFLYAGTEYIHRAQYSTKVLNEKGFNGYWKCFEESSMEKYVFEWLEKMHIAVREQHFNELANDVYEDLPQKTLDVFQETLKKVLPEIQTVGWVKNIGTDKDKHPFLLTFKLEDGTIRLYNMLSDGFRYLVLLVGELIVRAILLNKHLNKDQVLSQIDGVVLIDEYGIHLHPNRQAVSIQNLAKVFPKVQFIITTHSSLAINGLKNGQIYIIDKNNDGIRTIRNPERDIEGLGAEGILLEIFGLPTTFDEVTVKKLQQYHKLKQKSIVETLSSDEQTAFDQLIEEVSALAHDGSLQDPLYKRLLDKRKLFLANKAVTNPNAELSNEELDNLVDDLLQEWE